jgi:hypothetical protein
VTVAVLQVLLKSTLARETSDGFGP